MWPTHCAPCLLLVFAATSSIHFAADSLKEFAEPNYVADVAFVQICIYMHKYAYIYDVLFPRLIWWSSCVATEVSLNIYLWIEACSKYFVTLYLVQTNVSLRCIRFLLQWPFQIDLLHTDWRRNRIADNFAAQFAVNCFCFLRKKKQLIVKFG